MSAPVGDELHETPVGIPEVDASPAALRAVALRRPDLDLNPMPGQMLDGLPDGAVPLKAQVAVSGRNRNLGDWVPDRAGTMDIELLGAKSACPRPVAAVDELGAEHVPIERVRHGPVRYVDHAMIELGKQAAHPRDLMGRERELTAKTISAPNNTGCRNTHIRARIDSAAVEACFRFRSATTKSSSRSLTAGPATVEQSGCGRQQSPRSCVLRYAAPLPASGW